VPVHALGPSPIAAHCPAVPPRKEKGLVRLSAKPNEPLNREKRAVPKRAVMSPNFRRLSQLRSTVLTCDLLTLGLRDARDARKANWVAPERSSIQHLPCRRRHSARALVKKNCVRESPATRFRRKNWGRRCLNDLTSAASFGSSKIAYYNFDECKFFNRTSPTFQAPRTDKISSRWLANKRIVNCAKDLGDDADLSRHRDLSLPRGRALEHAAATGII